MFSRLRKPGAEGYSPLFFLSALGSGGLSISFFMYLMFWTPHQGSVIPTFSHVANTLQNGTTWLQITTALALVGIVFFGVNFIRIFIWNLRSFFKFQKTEAYQTLKNSNAETQLMAIPLTIAMGINVLFILGAVFVPGLWEMNEALFPLALVGFAAVGYLAFSIYIDFFSRAMSQGGFDCTKNNNLAQILPAFAFAMIGVGFAASAAMSHHPVTVILGMIGAIFLTVTAVVLALIKLVLGFRAMFEHGAATEGLPTFLVMIPVLTIVGITMLRLSHGSHTLEGLHTGSPFFWLTAFIGLQIMFGLFGLALKKRMGYFETFVKGSSKSPSSFALICPGVAFFVLANFWINKGLVPVLPAEYLSKFDLVYFLLYVPLIYLQYKTIRLYGVLNKKLLTDDEGANTLSAKTA
jgi:hypothetical protein